MYVLFIQKHAVIGADFTYGRVVVSVAHFVFSCIFISLDLCGECIINCLPCVYLKRCMSSGRSIVVAATSGYMYLSCTPVACR